MQTKASIEFETFKKSVIYEYDIGKRRHYNGI